MSRLPTGDLPPGRTASRAGRPAGKVFAPGGRFCQGPRHTLNGPAVRRLSPRKGGPPSPAGGERDPQEHEAGTGHADGQEHEPPPAGRPGVKRVASHPVEEGQPNEEAGGREERAPWTGPVPAGGQQSPGRPQDQRQQVQGQARYTRPAVPQSEQQMHEDQGGKTTATSPEGGRQRGTQAARQGSRRTSGGVACGSARAASAAVPPRNQVRILPAHDVLHLRSWPKGWRLSRSDRFLHRVRQTAPQRGASR
jgi:hypothetical protein